jgi:undecaprenyl-diphosphatase
MSPPPELQAAALGVVQGLTELLPVSSSAHVAALPLLLDWPARDKAFEVVLHAGAAAALAPQLLHALPGPRTLALSLAPAVVIGYLLERPIEERLQGPVPLAGGLLAGAAALAAADRAPQRTSWGGREARRRVPWRRAEKPGWRLRGGPEVSWGDALALGLAQAAALAPGVSRTGATLAAARARGFSRPAASSLSFGVAGPVLAGATALKTWRTRGAVGREAAVGGVAAFAAARLGLRIVGVERRRPLWPWAAERALLAGAILAVRYRRER